MTAVSSPVIARRIVEICRENPGVIRAGIFAEFPASEQGAVRAELLNLCESGHIQAHIDSRDVLHYRATQRGIAAISGAVSVVPAPGMPEHRNSRYDAMVIASVGLLLIVFILAAALRP